MQHQAVQLRDPKAVGSEVWVAEPSPERTLFPSAQTGASR